MKYKGIFFDFDYTLGDSTIPILRGFQESFPPMGFPKPTVEQIRPTVGMTLQDGYTMLTGDRDEGRRQEFFQRFQNSVGEFAGEEGRRIMLEETVLFPGCKELIRGLKEQGVILAMVSTKLGRTIRGVFTRYGLMDCFSLVVGSKDVTRHKPDPEGLNKAMRELALSPAEVLFCGDTVIDCQTALNAGVDFCAVLNGSTPAGAFAALTHVHISPDLNDLRGWLEGLRNAE